MGRNKIGLISLALVFLAGCGLVGFTSTYEWENEYLSLDEALARVRERHSDSRYGRSDSEYFRNLQDLWRQAPQEDKEIIEKEMLPPVIKGLESLSSYDTLELLETMLAQPRTWPVLRDAEILLQQVTSEEVRTRIDGELSEFMEAVREKVKRVREKQEQEKREQLETKRAEFEKIRERLTTMANGTLKDKSAQEVKKLVDEWRGQESLRWLRWEMPQQDKDGFLANFSTGTFYKIFGKPKRQQYLSGTPFIAPDCYLFYYDCKDGLVQIKVSVKDLDDDGVVCIIDLNIL